jgi:hypothetical protein
MEIQTKLKALADKIDKLKDKIGTEEATKNAFIMPFLDILGYDIFNPTEVVPEFIADQGIKKGEKVDYAIFQDDNPILIIECKHWNSKLDVQHTQLFRYFSVLKTRFALLTNGIEYRFYTDLDKANVMDSKPFLEFNICELKDSTIKEITKFQKSSFDVSSILDNAGYLKHTKELKSILNSELDEPSPEFVKFFISKLSKSKRATEKVIDEFTPLVKKAFAQLMNEKVNARLTSALTKEAEQQKDELEEEKPKSKIVTTEEEEEAFQIVVAILRRKIPKERITHRDTQSYFGILLDDNNRKPICRLHLNTENKYISLFDKDKNENRQQMNSIDDIYKFEKEILDVVDYYED